MGQYDIHVNGKTIGRGDNWDYPSEAQYYAFDATDAVTAGQPVALGALYHYWTCTCQGRANGPVANTTLTAAQAVGATNLKVAAQRLRPRRPDRGRHRHRAEVVTVTAIGTSGAAGTGITVTPALTPAHASGQAVLDYAGPSGFIEKAVVDHADGTRETFVSDGTWKISKATSTRPRRSRPATATPATRPSATTRAARSPAGTRRLRRPAWQPAYAIGAHPRPLNPLRETFSHLAPAISQLDYETIHPKSLDDARRRQRRRRLRQGHLRGPADRLQDGVAGRALVMQTSFRLNNTILSAATAAGATKIKVAAVANFVAGDKITVDQAANGFGAGDPEIRTITAVGTPARPARASRSTRRSAARTPTPATSRARAPAPAPTTPRAPSCAGGTPRRTARRPRTRCSTGAGATCRSCRPAPGRR